MAKTIYAVLLLVSCAYTSKMNAQSGNNLGGPFAFGIPCGANCTNLNFKVPVIKSTEDYTQQSIAYAPVLPYVTPTGNEVTSTYVDDKYSALLNLPFNFCMYGQSFNTFVIGSNGVVTFDATLANCINSYTFPNDIPFVGTAGCNTGASTARYPKFSVMGVFHDIDPSVTSTSPNRKIEWRIEGVAPTRKLVVSFYKIAMFSCTSLIATSQIIVYERSGKIEVFIENKPICSSWQSGKAILGIQKDETLALPVPNHNALSSQWSESNTGYRFTPNGTTNLLQNVIIKKKNGTLVGTATQGATANDSTSFSFNNYCLTGAGPDTLVVNANYASCTGLPADDYTLVDTIYVIKSPADLLATATVNPAICLSNTGSITVNVPTGAGTPPYQYSINGGTLQSSNVFTGLGVGTYTIFVKDASGSCTSTLTVSVGLTNPVTGTSTATAPSCSGATNGTLTITATNAIAPITYSLNGGTPQASNVFTGLAAGTYNITIKDGNGCNTAIFATVPPGSGTISATVTPSTTSCPGAANGSITVTSPTGSAPHQYAIGAAGAFGAANTFTGLAAGSYVIKVKDNNGCIVTYNISVSNGAGITATASTTATSCTGINNGTITVNANNGGTPYAYSLNGAANVASNVFTNLAAGTYTVKVTDVNNCNVTINVTVGTGSGVAATSTVTPTTCSGVNNGGITITASGGTSPYSYALDGATPQLGNSFTNVSAGSHTVVVTDAVGCNRTLNITVGTGTGINATTTTTATSCSAISNGTITITPNNGTAPYSYTLDGGTPQGSNTFTNVSSGSHTVVVTDALGCNRTINVTVGAGTVFTLSQTTTATTCAVASNGTATITATGASGTVQYAINGGANQTNNTFTNLPIGSHTVLVTDGNGCTNSITFSISAGPGITITGTPTPPNCNGGNNGQIIAAVSGTSTTPLQYQLNGGPLQSSNTFVGLAAGTYTLNVTDGAGCAATTSITVTQPTVLTAAATSTPAICNGAANGIITVNATGGTAGYQYSINNGTTYQSGNTFNVAAGTYTITVKDANNCTTTATVNVTQPNAVTVTSTTTNASCNGGADGTITATPSGGIPNFTYSIDGTTFQSGNTFNVLPGNYTVTAKDANGCVGTTLVTVSLTSNIVVNARPDTTICESKSVTLTTVSNATSFVWRPGITLNDSTVQSPVATPTVTTKYYVLATLGGCAAIDSVTVSVNPAPVANANVNQTICFGQSATLQGSGGVQYQWSSGSIITNANTFNPIVAPTTTTAYWLNVIDANGCSSLVADTMQVVVTPPLQAYAGPDTTIVMGQPYQLSATLLGASANLTGLQYLWIPSFGLSNATVQNPIATISANQNYTVEITTPVGCKGVATVRLQVLRGPDIYVPTAFTPNGDGVNDLFRAYTVGIKQFDYLRVFNRWGQLVFETKVPTKGWDAKLKGLDQPSGAYIYTVQGVTDAGKVITKKGSFVLVR